MSNVDKPPIQQNYQSPRWSGEICDCSMPVALDTYNVCSYNCLYCFGIFQKNRIRNYNFEVKSVNPKTIRKLFTNCLNDEPKTNMEKQFYPYIRDRITVQWNGLADGFDDYEREYGVTLELLKFFDEIDYPLSMGTKAAWWTEDDRYMSLLSKHTHNWHVKFSINTLDEYKASVIEEGCPSPMERLKAMKRVADLGTHVTLRLRPYIIGYSDDYPKLIRKAAKMGADSMVTEFLCVDSRAKKELKKRYDDMSEVLGYNLYEFYKKHSFTNGYYTLNYKLKTPIIKNMKKIAHKNKMRFYVSDRDHKDKCDSVCCCGTPPHMKVYTGHYAQALLIARQNTGNHTVRWKDIAGEIETYLDHFKWRNATGFNTNRSVDYLIRGKYTMADYLREIWNSPKNAKSPFKYFDGVLYPIGLDEQNNVIYKLNIKKMKS